MVIVTANDEDEKKKIIKNMKWIIKLTKNDPSTTNDGKNNRNAQNIRNHNDLETTLKVQAKIKTATTDSEINNESSWSKPEKEEFQDTIEVLPESLYQVNHKDSAPNIKEKNFHKETMPLAATVFLTIIPIKRAV